MYEKGWVKETKKREQTDSRGKGGVRETCNIVSHIGWGEMLGHAKHICREHKGRTAMER